jgi:Asp-tRNA(Asn)/Glu-tRNA(Gln) amidotransferase A subunit family amidase
MGKTSLSDYAFGAPDPSAGLPLPRNPWNLEHWPGGSSSGTASGLAAGLFYGGIGTDTGGSIRIPAACCGVTGFASSADYVPAQRVRSMVRVETRRLLQGVDVIVTPTIGVTAPRLDADFVALMPCRSSGAPSTRRRCTYELRPATAVWADKAKPS